MSPGPFASAVPRIAACEATEFRRAWVRRAEPVVVEGLARAWPASAQWTPETLGERFGDAPVQVMRAPGGRVDHTGTGGTTYDTTTLRAYVDALARAEPSPGYLVTMWQDLPAALRDDVGWPAICGRARWSQSTLWFGPEGIVSPMHVDVPDNVYVVVRGRKRFTLVPPRDTWRVRPHGLLSGQAQYARVDPERPDARASYARADVRVAELGDGDALYIPRFWWHHARGLATTLAVNFWWANGAGALLARAADGWKRVRGLSR